ncbi:lantibiotic dehydratase [Streptomyces sp. NPDC017940]|uniref:lantibiotic dehydratase n=1 Tax=Streptomyces sp. NPDC017940 TaxID=3365017 RepID=UPI0037B3F75E
MTPLYRHTGVALLRSTAMPLTKAPARWPDLGDEADCRTWLCEVWARPGLPDVIEQASPALAARVGTILDGRTVTGRGVRRAASAIMRYLLRATGRPTPFGLFAGVAPVTVGERARVVWGDGHRPVVRVGAEWLASIVERLEGCPELLKRLEVVFSNAAVRRGSRLEAPHGPNRVTISHTSAVQAVWEATTAPTRFGAVLDKVTEAFPDAPRERVHGMLAELVRRGFLITCLRAPFTVTDPLAHVLDRLHEAGAPAITPVVPLLRMLEAVHADVRHHNHEATSGAAQARLRTGLTRQMREVSEAGRTPLSMDLRLDCDVTIPAAVAGELEQAASVLARLTRTPTGQPAWRAFHAAFLDRYGTATPVPLLEVLDPDTGLGYPPGYPGSTQPAPTGEGPGERDERLLALAWQALADGSREIVLTEETITELAGPASSDVRRIPPHVEVSALIHATSTQALGRGDFTLTVAPARAAGTLTSRFTATASGSGLEDVYRSAPTATAGALPVQLSFPPLYAHAENVCRVPAYLDHVLPLGEHRGLCSAAPGWRTCSTAHEEEVGPELLALEDLAVTATGTALYLVSVSRGRVVEPQVFHALALEKQPPALARFLAHLPRAFTAGWHEFDWGPHTQRLPYLPRVRHGRTILAPARWYLTAADLPGASAGGEAWAGALDRWRRRWHLPTVVELRDADRTLRLNLDERAHTALLRSHLARHESAQLTESAQATEYGWMDGHAHEIALPLVTTRAPASAPLPAASSVTVGRHREQLPAAPEAAWLYAKIPAHPERQSEIVADYLPGLLASLDGAPAWWFVRYRSPHEADHLRLRIRTGPGEFAAHATAVSRWATGLREDGMAAGLTLDTYRPETSRYGGGPEAMEAAEAVFCADSHAVAAQLRHQPYSDDLDPAALVALDMVDICRGLLGSPDEALQWLAARPAPDVVVDRTIAAQVTSATRTGRWDDPGQCPEPAAKARQDRASALDTYRRALPRGVDVGAVLESLLHMHHNRALGIDRDRERACRRMARQAALTARALQTGALR